MLYQTEGHTSSLYGIEALSHYKAQSNVENAIQLKHKILGSSSVAIVPP